MSAARSSSIAEAFLLPSDVTLVDVDELDASSRHGLPSDHLVITRPRGRSLSGLVTPRVAALLRRFESPHTIVEAVIAYSAAEGLSPDAVLEDAFPALRSCIGEGFLVPADSPLAQPIGEALEPGDVVAGHEILSCVALLEDTEVYDALDASGCRVAVKLLRSGASDTARKLMENERSTLAKVPVPPAAALLASGEHEGSPYLIIEWVDGEPPVPRSTDRTRRTLVERVERAALVVEAFAELHAASFIHGDVHPGNVLIDATGRARVLDYGFARRVGEVRAEVGGTVMFSAPETMRGRVDQRSEQYSVGAVAYAVATGLPHMDFDIDREAAVGQAAVAVPRSVAELGFDPWPELDAVLGRALQVDPALRFASMGAFAGALRRLAPTRGKAPSLGSKAPGEQLVRDVLARWGRPEMVESLTFDDPHASVFFGVAGTADAIARIGRATGDLEAVHSAELLVRRAREEALSPGAWTCEAMEITDATVGVVSPYHRRNGVDVVQAFVGSTLADEATLHAASADFVLHSSPHVAPSEAPELALGQAGTLLWAAELTEMVDRADRAPLVTLGGGLHDQLAHIMTTLAPIAEERTFTCLGMAHGWAGLLYALLRWSEVTGRPPDPSVVDRIEQLVALRRVSGSSAEWRWTNEHGPAAHASMLGWCNGGAGHVGMLIAAHRVLGDDRYLDLAEQVALPLLAAPAVIGTICCGTAGCMYALASLTEATGNRRWRIGAERLVDPSASSALPALTRASTAASSMRVDASDVIPYSVFKGPVGLAMAIADLRAEDCDAPWLGFRRSDRRPAPATIPTE